VLLINALESLRGLKGDSSLSQFIAKEFGVINNSNKPDLTKELIINWAKRHYDEHGEYPRQKSGLVKYANNTDYEGIKWGAIDQCLRNGHRGLKGDLSLTKLKYHIQHAPHPT